MVHLKQAGDLSSYLLSIQITFSPLPTALACMLLDKIADRSCWLLLYLAFIRAFD
jgi:hypothetical protein